MEERRRGLHVRYGTSGQGTHYRNPSRRAAHGARHGKPSRVAAVSAAGCGQQAQIHGQGLPHHAAIVGRPEHWLIVTALAKAARLPSTARRPATVVHDLYYISEA